MYKKLIAIFIMILPMSSFSNENEDRFMEKMKPFYRSQLAPAIEQEFGGLNIKDRQKEKYVSIFLDSMAGCYLWVIQTSYGKKYLEVALDASSKGMGFIKAQEAMQMKVISDLEEGVLDKQTAFEMMTNAERNANACVAKSEHVMYEKMTADGIK